MNHEKKYIAGIDRLIPRPDLALEVLKLSQDQGSPITDLARKIEQDPNMTANMLRMANSSYFGHMREISSIREIIIRLGYDMVKILAITSAAAGILSSPLEAYKLEPRSLWNHSHACAMLAGIIARYAGLENSYTVYTGGLLHDIGKVVLNRPLLAACAENKKAEGSPTILELEHYLLKTDHAQIGRALLESWGLPESITEAVGGHHASEWGKTALPVRIVALANFLVDSIGIRAILPEVYMFNVDAYLREVNNLPEVPNFMTAMTSIMQEFFNRFGNTDLILA